MLQIFYQQAERGPGKVVGNLLAGLKKIGEKYILNPMDLETDDPAICLNGHPILYTDIIEDIVIGPNICTLPTDLVHFNWDSSVYGPRPPGGRAIVSEQRYKKFIINSEWTHNQYKKYGISENLLEIWPVGIDTDLFPEVVHNAGDLSPTYDCLIYFKRRDKEELKATINFLESFNQKYTIVEYGNYVEEDFKKTIKNSRYCFSLNGTESQGIAIQEIMSSNLPIFVWDVDKWVDRGPEHECPASSVPYWDERCGEKVYSLSKKESFEKFLNNLNNYSPRSFILESFTLKQKAQELVHILNK